MYRPIVLVCCVVALTWSAGCNKDDAAKMEEAAKTAAKSAADKTKEAVTDAYAAASEKATEAMKNVEGGPQLLKDVGEMFGSAEKTLAGVKDSETAKAAGTAMDELIAKIGGLSAVADKLPAEAKTALGGVVESGLAKLKELYEKAKSIPEVETVLKPKFDEFVAKLTALTGKSG